VKTDARTSLESLGLEKNPFGEAGDEFFAVGDRGRQLDELRHLARWSRRLLAVTGERGVGKSTLYRALSSRLDPGVKAARINANLTSDTREVLAAIIQGFGMAAPANADPRLLIELISLHVREQIDANRYCLVLIDDAHLLELRALEQLLKLVDAGAQEGLRIVFFAEAYFVQSLDKASKRSDQGQNWHEIRLSPFTHEESRRYIDFRLAAAGHEGRSPFTPNQISVIVGGSSGLPGRIDELASAILTGELRINDDRGFLPRMHRALVVLVLIAAGMGWLVFYNYGGSAPSQDTTTSHRASSANGATAAADSESAARSPPTTQSAEPIVNGDTSTLGLPVPGQASDAANETAASSAPAKQVDGIDANAASTLESAPAGAQSATAAPPPRIEAPKAAERKAEPAKVEIVKTEPTKAVGRPQTAQWLRQQPAKYFTVQLFATTSRAKRDAFVNQQDHPDRFATFETMRNGEPWYAVTYGVYATQTEAKSAAAALPASVGKVEPWVRTIASVQAAIQ